MRHIMMKYNHILLMDHDNIEENIQLHCIYTDAFVLSVNTERFRKCGRYI